MTHLSPELLAGVALESAEILDPAERSHLESCSSCRHEAESFLRAADLLRSADPSGPTAPPRQLWGRIAADLVEPAVEPLPPGPPGSSVSPVSPVTTIRRRPRVMSVLLAAAVGLVVGVGGTILVDRTLTRGEVVATTALTALPGHSGSGTAELVRHDGVTELRVKVVAGAPEDDYRELWLINTDGKRMYSLGVLPASGEWTYLVPPQLNTDLSGFTIVDVSLEPYDGQAAHSTNSLVRGSLPL